MAPICPLNHNVPLLAQTSQRWDAGTLSWDVGTLADQGRVPAQNPGETRALPDRMDRMMTAWAKALAVQPQQLSLLLS